MAFCAVVTIGAGVGTVRPKTVGPAVVVGAGIHDSICDWLDGGSNRGWRCNGRSRSSYRSETGLARRKDAKASLVGVVEMNLQVG
jgi:hypothetical protein